MNNIIQLLEVDVRTFLIDFFVLVLGFKFVVEALEWVFKKLGIEFSWMRKKDEDHMLLVNTTNDLKELHKNYEQEHRLLLEDMAITKETQKRIIETMNRIEESNTMRDKQISAIIVSQKETLAGEIDRRYKKYVKLGGIPSDEYDEFVSLHSAYNGVGGNHHGDAKFNYCVNHLPVLPVDELLPMEK